MSENLTDNVLIVLSCGTDNPNRSTRALFLASIAHKEGKNATLFLLDEGVYLAKKGIADNLMAVTGDAGADHLMYLQEYNVPILVCTPCAKSRQISEDDLVEGARMATGVELIHMTCKSAVISL